MVAPAVAIAANSKNDSANNCQYNKMISPADMTRGVTVVMLPVGIAGKKQRTVRGARMHCSNRLKK